MSPHTLTNFEIKKNYQKESKFSSVYSRNNVSKIKDGTFIKVLDEYESIGTHWIALYVNDENVTNLGVQHIPREIRKFIRNKKYYNKYF